LDIEFTRKNIHIQTIDTYIMLVFCCMDRWRNGCDGIRFIFEFVNLFLLPFQEWDNTLAELAQGLADTCVFKHTNLQL